ncbi:MAG: conjugal transfer protein TrbE [Fusobacterium gastrosuis]|uniref:TraG/VirB4 family ATPase n=1 Tax=Fusobacterium gastrosuis TaxID=1755100 RepID=UPI002974A19A|nr:conjugal transfer protein TrbE [Fusobacteriaceae bacterium]MDY4010990.1 conjugal transfer protein TrbE [Fusobacterium gastrosuis]MDY5713558.1 conjugal transfer protein TrbE [Fusobacterium gastrosuis]
MLREFKKMQLPKKFKNNDDSLTDLLPWAYIYENVESSLSIGEGDEINRITFPIIITKDGSFQTTLKFRGRDLDSCTPDELYLVTERCNNVLKQLDATWTLHLNAIRRKSHGYIQKENIKIIPLKIIELERNDFFTSGNHYETDYYLTFTYNTPEDKLKRAKNLFFRNTDVTVIENHFKDNIKYYNDEMYRLYFLLSEVLSECRVLNIDETLTYYHNLISDVKIEYIKAPKAFIKEEINIDNGIVKKESKIIAVGIELPEIYKKDKENIKEEILPVLIDNYISDTPLIGGITPQLGKEYIKAVSLLSFPGNSIPGILDQLNRLNLEYTWSTRYIMLDKINALKTINMYTKRWGNARTSILNLIKEELFKKKAEENESAAYKEEQIKQEKVLVEQEDVALGYYTTTIILRNQDKNVVEKSALAIRAKLNSLGFTAEIENFNILDCFFGALPGNVVMNERQPPQNSRVYSHLIPLNAVWAGDERNEFLKKPPLLYCQTVGYTPFRLNLHYKDVAHTLIVGPTGSGKSVLLGMLQAEYLAYTNTRVIAFDKGASTRVLNKACSGVFYDLGEDNVRFQPLRDIGDNSADLIEKFKKNHEINAVGESELIVSQIKEIEIKERNRANKEKEWCQEWIEDILESNLVELTPAIKNYIWNTLTQLALLPIYKRTMTSFVDIVGGQSKVIKDALKAYYGDGPYAKYFDGDTDFLKESDYIVFEMEKILETKSAITPTLNYLFHVIETKIIDKKTPTLLTLDECWVFLDNPKFENKIREWLKVMRKNNVGVIFATQSLSDIAESKIKSAILDACYTRIYLPNSNAKSEVQQSYYKMFDLNDTEINIIYNSVPKRQYYFKSPKGSRLFELALSKLELSYVATSGGKDLEKCKELGNLSEEEFNRQWLNYKGFDGDIIIKKIKELIEKNEF